MGSFSHFTGYLPAKKCNIETTPSYLDVIEYQEKAKTNPEKFTVALLYFKLIGTFKLLEDSN